MTPGPYIEGGDIRLTCGVPRAKGNISGLNLQGFLGDRHVADSTLHDNPDGTLRLTLNKVVLAEPSHHNLNVNCRYVTPNGTTQEDSLTIHIENSEYTCFCTLSI